jgi:large subunit ribosomal protein L21
MYAIVEIAGKQFRVEKDAKMYVPRLKDEVGADVTFDKVLLTSGDGGVTVGTPTVEGASVSAKVLDHVKGDKIIVFKKKRRKGYRVKNGHRQPYTQIQIGELSTN